MVELSLVLVLVLGVVVWESVSLVGSWVGSVGGQAVVVGLGRASESSSAGLGQVMVEVVVVVAGKWTCCCGFDASRVSFEKMALGFWESCVEDEASSLLAVISRLGFFDSASC